MNWYIAKIVYRILTPSSNDINQFEDQLRLIFAKNEKEALKKSYSIGEKEQFSFYNNNRQLIQWKFINVSELLLVSDQLEGAELYSAVTEVSNADSYIRLVNDKSANICQSSSRKLLNLI